MKTRALPNREPRRGRVARGLACKCRAGQRAKAYCGGFLNLAGPRCEILRAIDYAFIEYRRWARDHYHSWLGPAPSFRLR